MGIGSKIENQWLDGFRQGREQSFTAIFETLFPALSLYSFRLTNDQAASEDLAQEAFLKIWERKEHFFQFNVLKSYLYTTVRNDSINWLQKKDRQLAHGRILETTVESQENSILHDMIRAEVFQEVFKGIKGLPPKCRQIFNMLYIEGKTTRQIAEELNITKGTVKMQKARGLMLLRKRLPDLLLIITGLILSHLPLTEF